MSEKKKKRWKNKSLSWILAGAVVFGSLPAVPLQAQAETLREPVLAYDFEQDLGKKIMTDSGAGDETKDNGTLFGNASIVYDEELKSNVLRLDGSRETYAEIPQGFFDGRDVMSVSMDVKSDKGSGNFFTFTYGKNDTVYNNLRIRGQEVRNAITTGSYWSERDVRGQGVPTREWQNVTLVISGKNHKLYVDGILAAENTDTGITTSDLGRDLQAYLGKSFYPADEYFKGSFDNIRIYDRILSSEEIFSDVIDRRPLLKWAQIGWLPEDPSAVAGTDNHTAGGCRVDRETKEIHSYVRKGEDFAKMPVSLNLLTPDVKVKANGQDYTGGPLDLTGDVELKLMLGNKEETYILKKPILARNAVLPGQYADPDIDYFDGKYWIFPTTDGRLDWNPKVFHAWSSVNLEDWVDEGVILNVADKAPGLNEQGVQIASSMWSDGNAWAPSIEKKNGKYYFYYCGNVNEKYRDICGEGKAIGVAVADNPAGPYVANEMPILYPKMMEEADFGFGGQVIDPSIFTDDDGKSYLFFGNGTAAVAELNDDMLSVKKETLRVVWGLHEFRESVVVTKRNGLYHFTWSCDDTGSPNYHVNYGTAKSLDENVTFHYTLLEKDEENDMLGTAHQSVLYMPETDQCYIAYHRFYTPFGVYTDSFGCHRESCIDMVSFDEKTGLMKPVTPTMEGVSAKKQEDVDKLEEYLKNLGELQDALPQGKIDKEEKLTLPRNLKEAEVTWNSDNTAVIKNDGTVILPENDTTVTLTAAITYGTACEKKKFKLEVKGVGENLRTIDILDDFSDDKYQNRYDVVGNDWQADASDGTLKFSAKAGDKIAMKGVTMADGIYQMNLTITSDGGNAGIIFRAANLTEGGDGLDGYYVGIGDKYLQLGRMNQNWTELKGVEVPELTLGSTHTLKVAAFGSRIQVYLDDVAKPYIDITDSTYKKGAVGIRGHWVSGIADNLKVATIPSYQTGFENGTGEWSNEESWRVEDGVYTASSNAYSLVDSKPVKNLIYWADLTMSGGDAKAVLIVRASEAENGLSGYGLAADAKENKLQLIKAADGQATVLSETVCPEEIMAGRIAIEIKGDTLKAYAGDSGKAILKAQDGDYAAGQVGVWNMTGTSFIDNITVSDDLIDGDFQANTDELNDLIAKIGKLDANKYTQESYAKVQEALEKAKKADVTDQTSVDEAVKTLKNALAGLKEKPAFEQPGPVNPIPDPPKPTDPNPGEPVKTIPKLGQITTQGRLVYKVTKSAASGGTVAVVKPSKKTWKTAAVPKSILWNGYTFKVTSINRNAFRNNKKLVSVKIGDNVSSIGTQAFAGCGRLKRVNIGKGLKTLGSRAFYRSKSLKKITIKSTKLKKVYKKAFTGISGKAVLHVSGKRVKKYSRIFRKAGLPKSSKVK